MIGFRVVGSSERKRRGKWTTSKPITDIISSNKGSLFQRACTAHSKQLNAKQYRNISQDMHISEIYISRIFMSGTEIFPKIRFIYSKWYFLIYYYIFLFISSSVNHFETDINEGLQPCTGIAFALSANVHNWMHSSEWSHVRASKYNKRTTQVTQASASLEYGGNNTLPQPPSNMEATTRCLGEELLKRKPPWLALQRSTGIICLQSRLINYKSHIALMSIWLRVKQL